MVRIHKVVTDLTNGKIENLMHAIQIINIVFDYRYVTNKREMINRKIKEYCKNNNAQLAVVPKVKYFKVGFGKYVFSNQVIISMKLYDSMGNFLTETNYDTYKKNARILGSAENSIKIGTSGAVSKMGKNLRKSKSFFLGSTED